MSTETNKETVREFISRVFEDLDTSAVDDLVADDFVSHSWRTNEGQDAKQSLKEATTRMSVALSDITFRVEDLIAEDDRVVARLTASARQTGGDTIMCCVPACMSRNNRCIGPERNALVPAALYAKVATR